MLSNPVCGVLNLLSNRPYCFMFLGQGEGVVLSLQKLDGLKVCRLVSTVMLQCDWPFQ